MRKITVDHMEVGPADGAGFNSDQDLSRPGLGGRKLDFLEPLSRLFQDHATHGVIGIEPNGGVKVRRLFRKALPALYHEQNSTRDEKNAQSAV